MSTLSQPASHPSCLDDELTALMLQLEELGVYSNTGKGKHPVGRPPNIEIVYDQFQAELRDYKTFLDDQKLAKSIGAAVHTDGAIIEDVLSQNVQAHEDHRFALELSNNDPEIETPPPFCDALHADIQDWRSSVPHGIAAASITEFSDDEIKAGPSMTYADRQADVLNKLCMQFQCCACTDRFPRASMVTTKCSHRYCNGCMKSLFMRSTRDEGLYPPRCCRQSIPLTLVAKHMTEDELETFQLSAVEYATNDKTYCSNPECATFLPPATIDADTKRVACPKCGIETCAICKNTYHSGEDCPEDDALQQTRVLARAMGWQTCFGCNRVVILRSGCNHMTCKCRAEFCYVCGVRWKECICATADPDRIEERAEEIVGRNLEPGILPAEQHQRVEEVLENLRENHECEHSRPFQRMFDAPRRGFRCELCDSRHRKYILQCRLCYLNVCKDCRRNRT